MSIARHIRQLGSETAVYGVAATLGRFVNVLLIPVYTRALSPGDYGLFGIMVALVTMASFLLTSLDNAAGRWFFDSEKTEDRKSVISTWFWAQVAVAGVFVVIVVVAARPIAAALMGSGLHVALIWLAAAFSLVTVFGKVLSYWLRLQHRPWALVWYSTTTTIGTGALVVLFVVVWHQGVTGVYVGQVLAGAVVALLAVAILKSWIAPRRSSLKILKEMVRFSAPVIPATMAAWATASSDRFIMPWFLSNAEIGVYFLAFQLASVVALLDAAFQMAWGPFALSLLNHADAARIYSKVFSLYGLLGCCLATAIALFAPLVLSVVSTPAYYSASTSIGCLVFFFLAVGMTNVVGIGSLVAKNSRPIAVNIFIGAAGSTGLFFVLVPFFGKEGAAVAKLAGMVMAVVYMYVACQRLYPLPYRPRDVLVSFGFAWFLIGCGAWLAPASGAVTWGIRSVMCLLFVPLGLYLRIVRPEDLRRLFAAARYRPVRLNTAE